MLIGIAGAWASELAAQGSLARRLERLLDRRSFNRASWGVLVVNQRGQTVFERNADRRFVPASTAKLAVTAAASMLLPPDYRITTSVFGTGPLTDGVLQGDLVVYGRGDPGFGAHCHGPDTLAAGVCDAMWTRLDALADSLVARGVGEVAGAIVGDGSYFDRTLVHPEWQGYHLNWWYAAPVSGLGFNDNSVNITWKSGPRVGAPAVIRFEPDPNRYFAQALRAALIYPLLNDSHNSSFCFTCGGIPTMRDSYGRWQCPAPGPCATGWSAPRRTGASWRKQDPWARSIRSRATSIGGAAGHTSLTSWRTITPRATRTAWRRSTRWCWRWRGRGRRCAGWPPATSVRPRRGHHTPSAVPTCSAY
ncbi:MAG: D-alanyl-D-alanine carboxypeptidase [Gemmatimonadetes bacterium]|nr:D-alanyl-D-alanine carboxypeptidase [Gemmatimonadota bacterium]